MTFDEYYKKTFGTSNDIGYKKYLEDSWNEGANQDRKECAKLCDEKVKKPIPLSETPYRWAAQELADEIRERQ